MSPASCKVEVKGTVARSLTIARTGDGFLNLSDRRIVGAPGLGPVRDHLPAWIETSHDERSDGDPRDAAALGKNERDPESDCREARKEISSAGMFGHDCELD